MNTTIDVVHGKLARYAVVHRPPGYDPTKPTPLVLAFHFSGGTPFAMKQATHLDEAADEAGAIIAYPAGIEGSFNAGKCCGKAWEDKVDDVGFTAKLLDALSHQFCIDESRVSATGHSNGALMTYRLGCELSERFSAIAPVAGAVHTALPCQPSRPLAVLHIHGTEDTAVPYDGGPGVPPVPIAGSHDYPSVSASTATWRQANGCADEAEYIYKKGNVACAAWLGCASEATVELCVVVGGGHTWPGGNLPAPWGATTTDLDASERILQFVTSHPAAP